MKRIGALLVSLCLFAFPAARAGPSAGGISSDNVEWLAHIPLAMGTAEGGRILDGYFYVTTNQQGLLIFDVRKPSSPQLVGRLPLPHVTENEDVPTNGHILLMSQLGDASATGARVPVSTLYVVDVSEKSNPTVIATVPGAGDHTYECLFNCSWAYSAKGFIVDLRKPRNPRFLDKEWTDARGLGARRSAHDVTEVRAGLVLTASEPMVLLDTSDPADPRVLAMSDGSANSGHNVVWPRGGGDRLIMSATEAVKPRCTGDIALFKTWDASQWKRTRTFRPIDEYGPSNGTFTDGNPPVSATWYGCSAHWFEEHSSFDNGGLVAASFYSHGVRFLNISATGKINEVGWFLPHGGSSAAAYWANDEIVYSVDLDRGIDVLRFKRADS
ncbi:MAG: LVIVD repeat-containing protein [Actinomycetota bacterium]